MRPDVHELDDDESAVVVHRIGDATPTRDVIVAVDARRERIALSVVGGLGALGDDERHRRALRVVLRRSSASARPRASSVRASSAP